MSHYFLTRSQVMQIQQWRQNAHDQLSAEIMVEDSLVSSLEPPVPSEQSAAAVTHDASAGGTASEVTGSARTWQSQNDEVSS